MKVAKRFFLSVILSIAVAIPCFAIKQTPTAVAATTVLTTTPTGYTKASDVTYVYKTVEQKRYIANWGARGEDCTFLSENAQSFYTGSYVYDTLSQITGGSSQSNAPSSALYSTLQTFMKSKHKTITSYEATKKMYCCTDCVSGRYSNISSFYSGKEISGTWDSGSTWNREHTWPDSKGKGGSDENDIMMLRPTSTDENSSRGNTAYGEGGGYYDPNQESKKDRSVRGDCARIVLYVYVRWGNTSRMWGSNGVMENLNILLKWMKEDPVDTWEMGRNDSVESITGTRNVFVDYPEYAWLLFGQPIPKDMVTPSSEAANGNGPTSSSSNSSSSSSSSGNYDSSSKDSASNSAGNGCAHNFTDWFVIQKPTSESEGYQERYCADCGTTEKETLEILVDHNYTEWFVIKKPTMEEEGYRERYCPDCGKTDKETLPKLSDLPKDSMQGCESAIGSAVASAVILLSACIFVFVKKEESC